MCCRIKELCQQFPHGITDQVIQNDMPHLEPQDRAMAINKLLSLVSLLLCDWSLGSDGNVPTVLFVCVSD